MSKVLYRYIIDYRSEDNDTDVRLMELPVIRQTEKMYYVKRYYWGDAERGIRKDAHNTYAYDTKEKAKSHFIRRTGSRISWYDYWKNECEKALDLIQKVDTNE